ncbi:MAG: restriction endonuclease [Candidatus Yanofskybacteria bacterium]|nr:restriction endonuclease [Candidatus Yanofskybacteria bacterium]
MTDKPRVEAESLKMTLDNSLSEALKYFEIAEANLLKLENLWQEIERQIPSGIEFKTDLDHEEKCRAFEAILPHLPTINDWKPSAKPWSLNEIAHVRLDALQLGEPAVEVSVEEGVQLPGQEIRKYRFLLNQKRRELVRDRLIGLVDSVDADIRGVRNAIDKDQYASPPWIASEQDWNNLRDHVGEINTLLGSNERPPRWNDLQRHIRFAEIGDFHDIEKMDWPTVKPRLLQDLYGESEPIPSQITDLSTLVNSKPRGPVTKQLHWDRITSETLERLIFMLISNAEGYENAQWLTHTNAPDHGRDLSVERVIRDSLGGVTRNRVIIQCKHWLSKSVSVAEVQTLQAQMKLWEPPRVDVHIIATTGRFTTDAIDLIERENRSDKALRIEMWPESHLENLLAPRPELIAEFNLR